MVSLCLHYVTWEDAVWEALVLGDATDELVQYYVILYPCNPVPPLAMNFLAPGICVINMKLLRRVQILV